MPLLARLLRLQVCIVCLGIAHRRCLAGGVGQGAPARRLDLLHGLKHHGLVLYSLLYDWARDGAAREGAGMQKFGTRELTQSRYEEKRAVDVLCSCESVNSTGDCTSKYCSLQIAKASHVR